MYVYKTHTKEVHVALGAAEGCQETPFGEGESGRRPGILCGGSEEGNVPGPNR